MLSVMLMLTAIRRYCHPAGGKKLFSDGQNVGSVLKQLTLASGKHSQQAGLSLLPLLPLHLHADAVCEG